MLKVLDAIQLSTDYLTKKGIDEPRLNAELLLADILGMKRLNLYLNYDRPLSEKEKDLYRTFLSRRANYEPLQYILGYTEFWSYKFAVNKSVLIPRPETEILVETILNDYSDNDKELNILDIGTGSGIIAICLAKNLNCKVTAIDISIDAINLAKENAAFNSVSDKITFIENDILKFNDTKIKYDIIVSNPPYVDSIQYNTLQKEIKLFEPAIAVTDFNDGLTFYKKIISMGNDILIPSGKIYFEIGAGQSNNINSLFEKYNYFNITNVKDYANISRVVKGELGCEL